jgi:hypothetical protein
MAGNRRLYILGNGFDLHHKLPTKYSDFKIFVEHKFPDLFGHLNAYFNEDMLWKDFEKGLATYRDTDFFDTQNNVDPLSEDFRPSYCYDLEDDINEQTDNLISSIIEALTQWIGEVNEILDNLLPSIKLDTSALYLCFNYTDTLPALYKIPTNNILYIHGSNTELEELIIGHNVQRDPKNELDENGDSYRTIFTDSQNAAEQPFFAFQKPTNEIIEKNKNFFDILLDINEIYVLGHSLSEIDLPYFTKTKEQVCKTASWYISFYEENQKKELLKSIKLIGCNSYKFIQMSDLT